MENLKALAIVGALALPVLLAPSAQAINLGEGFCTRTGGSKGGLTAILVSYSRSIDRYEALVEEYTIWLANHDLSDPEFANVTAQLEMAQARLDDLTNDYTTILDECDVSPV